eukprot:GHRR01004019.1.p1 GENE.GHRR01004019.1~~GHRR01004019.1.p1  ORF type:complete len:1293 (+),score=472.26 GHRR01004019.1:779-4657(+)
MSSCRKQCTMGSHIVLLLAVCTTMLSVGAFVAGWLQQFCWMYSSVRQTNRLRGMYLRGILRQDIGFFDTQATTGGLLQGLNEDSLAIQQAISDKVGAFLQHSSTFVVGFIIAFVKGWDMTLVLLGCLPFLAGIGGLLAKMTTTLSGRQTAAYTEAGGVVQQSLSQIRTVAAYNGEEAAYKEYNGKLDLPQKVGNQQGIIGGVTLGGMQFVMFCSYAIALFYGAVRISQGYYTGGDVMSVMFAALMGAFSLGLAAPNLQYFSKGASAGSKVFEVINLQPAIDAECDGDQPPTIKGSLQLEGVSFAYPARPDVTVLKGLTLDIPAGKTVALVGSSGSGKSTVVGLIERFYDPLEGRVLLDGKDIKTLKLEWLRTQVGLVSQEPTLFATTIYDNILQGREGATEAEVHEAAKAANAHNFISALPAGYQTQVGERGVQLSGGQKQRIAIGRAILKNPKILLLDEATSALDSESEAIVQDALDRMVVGRTTVVIAHRLSTIQNADVIVVMQQGVMVEQGSHEELLANPTGAYTNLVKLQMQQQQQSEAQEAEVAEVVASDGRPLSRSSIERVMSRHSSAGAGELPGQQRSKLSLDEALEAERAAVANRVSKDLQIVVQQPQTSPEVAIQPPKEGASTIDIAAFNMAEGTAGGAVGAAAASTRKRGWFKGRRLPTKGTVVDGGKTASTGEEKAKEKAPEIHVPFSRLLALNKPEWPYLVLGSISSAVVGGIQPAFAFVMSSMITVLFLPDPATLRQQASFYSWMFFVVACGVLLATAGQQWSFAVMGQALSRRMRVMLFKSTLRQEIGWFDMEENSSGKLASALSSDATVLRGAVGDVFGVIIQNIAVMSAGYIIAFVYNWRMALLVTGAAPLVVVGGWLHIKLTFIGNSSSDNLYSTANNAVAEAVSNIRVIQAYTMQGRVIVAYKKLLHEANNTNCRVSLISAAAMGYSQFVMFAMYGLITWFGGLEVSLCRSTFEQFLKAFMCVLFAALGLAQAQVGFPDLAKAKGALQRVFPIIDRTPAIDSSSPDGEAPDSRAVRGELELQHVVFAYPNRPQVKVFNNFCLKIPAGQTVALVGESGSGKSTVVGLIERFYDPLEGRLLLDGKDLRQYNVRWLRQQIGLVSQEPLLFSGSILDNIRYGRPHASLVEVEAVARAANAHDFICTLPEGYNTKVGERGMQLSGGQKQRVAIARAVVKDPKVLLLDEATSALDAASERLVQDALDRIMAGRTSVVVAHRLSTIRNANCIAVVYRGVILEQGRHEELMAMPNGGYARLVAAQMKQHVAGPAAAAAGVTA